MLYNHFIYLSGYRYLDKVIGHTLDSNSKYYSINAVLTKANGFEVGLKYQNMLINTEANTQNRLSASREKINSLSLNITAQTSMGKLTFNGKVLDNYINTPQNDNANVIVGLSWEVGF